MAELTEVKVPDIGDFDGVPVIEILVSKGDRVSAEDPLVTLESDKATMDVPSPADGVVGEIKVAVGDTVSEGSVILMLEGSAGEAGGEETAADDAADDSDDGGGDDQGEDGDGDGSRDGDSGPAGESAPGSKQEASPAQASSQASSDDDDGGGGGDVEVKVPDIGDFDDVPVIEILVAEGDQVEAETPLVTLESDKATMDVPAPQAGTVKSILVSVGDTVSEGKPIVVLSAGAAASSSRESAPAEAPASNGDDGGRNEPVDDSGPDAGSTGDEDATPLSEEFANKYGASEPDPRAPSHRPSPTASLDEQSGSRTFHATPAVRRFARELGVDIGQVRGTGRKGRIVREDVQSFVKQALSAPASPGAAPAASGGMGIEPIPAVDFSRFGEVEEYTLPRIKRISGPFLHRSWLNVPHVTHHDEADVTALEEFRNSLKKEAEKKGVRVTALTFIMKAVARTLAEFPNVNASLSPDGASLIRKKYFHIGIAVDTPNGLVVPVFRDVDKKGVFDLAAEMADVSARARDGKLKPDEMQGGCISISSLGGIGGTAFTPIVNAPEVAILGVSRAKMQPVWDGTEFQPRLMLPLDLSFDHRAMDGAEAARFVAHLCGLLGDLRRLML